MTLNRIQTVTGLILTEEITLADAHAHVWIQPPEGVSPKARLELNDPRRIETELKDFCSAGGNLLVDCQPGGCGRDARMLVKLAEAAEIHVTAVTGFHLERYYPAGHWLWSASEVEAAAYFIKELTESLQEKEGALATAIKIGFNGKIEGQTRVLMEAAAEAARQTGAGLLFHTEQGDGVENLPLFFEDRSVSSDRLYLCHVDKRPDEGLHKELAQAGALLGYDTFARAHYKPEQNVWPLLLAMVSQGYDAYIALGLDLAANAMWRSYGGWPGLVALPDKILTRLHHEGLSETIVCRLTAQNIVQFLVRDQESGVSTLEPDQMTPLNPDS